MTSQGYRQNRPAIGMTNEKNWQQLYRYTGEVTEEMSITPQQPSALVGNRRCVVGGLVSIGEAPVPSAAVTIGLDEGHAPYPIATRLDRDGRQAGREREDVHRAYDSSSRAWASDSALGRPPSNSRMAARSSTAACQSTSSRPSRGYAPSSSSELFFLKVS